LERIIMMREKIPDLGIIGGERDPPPERQNL
jgi:hypothetical protein